MTKHRRKTRQVKVKNLIIGGGFPVSVQTMWKEPLTLPPDDVCRRIAKFASMGCEIIRFAVPKIEDAEYIGNIAKLVEMPVVADIHFDYKIALKCMDYPIAKIRINPGNIGNAQKAKEVILKAKDKNIPLRIGVNSGSLPKNLVHEKSVAKAMVKAAEMELEVLSQCNFTDAVFSLKSAEIGTTVEANMLFSELYDFPLHLGVTEAGPLIHGVVKNTIALTRLFASGTGDTVRISLSDTPENEIIAGMQILSSLEIKEQGVSIVSCPMCSRAAFDVHGFTRSILEQLSGMNKNITIAVMGCPVNGPGEAKKADIGITGSGNFAVIFKEGVILRKISLDQAPEAFLKEIGNF